MKKLVVILFLLFAVSASAQTYDVASNLPVCPVGSFYIHDADANEIECSKGDVVKEARAKIEAEDRKALVSYAVRLLRKIEEYQRKLDELRETLARVERGEVKAHQIPSGANYLIGSTATTFKWNAISTGDLALKAN